MAFRAAWENGHSKLLERHAGEYRNELSQRGRCSPSPENDWPGGPVGLAHGGIVPQGVTWAGRTTAPLGRKQVPDLSFKIHHTDVISRPDRRRSRLARGESGGLVPFFHACWPRRRGRSWFDALLVPLGQCGQEARLLVVLPQAADAQWVSFGAPTYKASTPRKRTKPTAPTTASVNSMPIAPGARTPSRRSRSCKRSACSTATRRG